MIKLNKFPLTGKLKIVKNKQATIPNTMAFESIDIFATFVHSSIIQNAFKGIFKYCFLRFIGSPGM